MQYPDGKVSSVVSGIQFKRLLHAAAETKCIYEWEKSLDTPGMLTSDNFLGALSGLALNDRKVVVIGSFLLDDPLVDPTFKNNRALKAARNGNYYSVVGLLKADPRVNSF
jgi:hypothetical protein